MVVHYRGLLYEVRICASRNIEVPVAAEWQSTEGSSERDQAQVRVGVRAHAQAFQGRDRGIQTEERASAPAGSIRLERESVVSQAALAWHRWRTIEVGESSASCASYGGVRAHNIPLPRTLVQFWQLCKAAQLQPVNSRPIIRPSLCYHIPP